MSCVIILDDGFHNLPLYPHPDAGPEQERDHVGQEEGEHDLCGAGPRALGRHLRGLGGFGGGAGGGLEAPLLGRCDVGARAPVPDEVRDLRVAGVAVAQRVDVDITETSYF